MFSKTDHLADYLILYKKTFFFFEKRNGFVPLNNHFVFFSQFLLSLFFKLCWFRKKKTKNSQLTLIFCFPFFLQCFETENNNNFELQLNQQCFISCRQEQQLQLYEERICICINKCMGNQFCNFILISNHYLNINPQNIIFQFD